MTTITISLDNLGPNATMDDVRNFAEFLTDNIKVPYEHIRMTAVAAAVVTGGTEGAREAARLEVDRLWNAWLAQGAN